MAPRRTRSRCFEAAVLAAALAAAVAHAGTRLDDSQSPRQRFDLQTRWEYLDGESNAPEQLMAIIAEARDVEVRLNTTAWAGRNAEIYIVFPAEITGLRLPSAMRIEWRTRGRLNAGVAIPGQRALVFRGRIEGPVTGDFFDFTYRIDGRHFDRRMQFQPVFEIEPLP
jgi:hypothetical protein